MRTQTCRLCHPDATSARAAPPRRGFLTGFSVSPYLFPSVFLRNRQKRAQGDLGWLAETVSAALVGTGRWHSWGEHDSGDEKPLSSPSHNIGVFTVPQQSIKKKEEKHPQEPGELLGYFSRTWKEGWGGDWGPQRALVASVPPQFAGCLCEEPGAAEGLRGDCTGRSQVGKATAAAC